MIIISPYSKPLRNGKRNAKNYPHWSELVIRLRKKYDDIIQIGIEGEEKIKGVKEFKQNLSLSEIKKLVQESEFWISVDNFLPHLSHHVKKPGVVIWGFSDPNIFGYPENLNILKDRKNLRQRQFDIWEIIAFNPNVFLSADEIIKLILNWNMNK